MRRIVYWTIGFAISQALVLLLLAWILPGFNLTSFWAAVLTAVSVTVVTSATWPFIYGLAARFHPLLFPVVSFFLFAAAILLSTAVANSIDADSVKLDSFWNAMLVAIGLTFMNAFLSALFSLDDDSAYNRFVLRPPARAYHGTSRTDVPGFIFIEIDGLALPILRRAIADNYMPTLQRWLEDDSHTLNWLGTRPLLSNLGQPGRYPAGR